MQEIFMQEVINIIISNGVFAMLFVGLLFYQLKDSSQREKKYIETIEKLSKHIDIIEDVKEDVSEIKNILIIKKSKKEQKNEV
jgi:cephalosporin hydroxylase